VLLAAVCVPVWLALAGNAAAATFMVNTTADSIDTPACVGADVCSLRDAVIAADGAGSASTIVLPAGSYGLLNTTHVDGCGSFAMLCIVNPTYPITISGAGAGSTTIENAVGGSNEEAFYVYNDSLSLSGVTIEDTDSGDGGAIYNEGTLSINNSVISNSEGSNGGGAVYANAGAVSTSITNSTLSGNSSSASGGALYIYDGSLRLTNDFVTGNNANSGGGDGGGAVWDESNDPITISGSLFTDNGADFGGAIWYSGNGAFVVTNDTFEGNTAAGAGGAIDFNSYAPSGSVLLNDTIADNTAENGGGIGYPYSANSIENTIVADNTGGDCAGVADFNARDADTGGNIDSDGSCFGGDGVASDQTSVNAMLGSLANNGGPTETAALLAGSPAIGAGVAAGCVAAVTDQRGVARPASGCDVGAFQTVPPVPSATISKSKISSKHHSAKFTITASGDTTSFECALVRLPHAKHAKTPKPHYGTCGTSKSYSRLKDGRYVFYVRAIGPGGTQASPATHSFKIT
jgi:hypothetical protein